MYFELKNTEVKIVSPIVIKNIKTRLYHVAIHNFNFFLSEDCFLLHLDAEGY